MFKCWKYTYSNKVNLFRFAVNSSVAQFSEGLDNSSSSRGTTSTVIDNVDLIIFLPFVSRKSAKAFCFPNLAPAGMFGPKGGTSFERLIATL